MGYRISIDLGGTFTDLTLADGEVFIARHKSPSTPEDLTQGVFNCLKLAGDSLNISLQELLNRTDVFIHSSTTATNAILEGRGAKCGLICTKGTKYALWKGEGRKEDPFDYKTQPPPPLLRPYLCLEVTERINREGEVLVPLDEEEVRAAVRQLKKWNVKTIAVCLLWSIINPAHEQRVGEIIKEEWPEVDYCLSSEVQPILREYHRQSCVVLNSMLKPVVSAYLGRLQKALAENGFKGEVLIVVSSGGIVPIREIMERPVFMLFSGPAMGPVAGRYYAEQQKQRNALVIDMGGTSFDVSTIIEDHITTTREAKIGKYPTGVAATEILTMGSGGGSIGWVDSAGKLWVGPQSAGAVPGPACYMKGGIEPTVTDACVILGYIVQDYFLGGRMKISPELAQTVIKEQIAEPLKLTVEKAALGIYQVCKENMIGGMFDMTVRRGVDPREFVIVAAGGATGMFIGGLAQELGVKQVIIPKEKAVLCAFGGLNADIALSSVASRYTNTKSFNYDDINGVLEELEAKGEAFLAPLPAGGRKFEYYCAARYPMQVTELEIALSDKRVNPEVVSKLAEDFHAASLARYKTSDPASAVEFVMWRHIATSVTPRIELAKQAYSGEDPSTALMGGQPVYFEGREDFIETPYYDGDKLTYGMKVDGPALVVLTDTTIVVPPRFKISTQEHGYFIMEVPAKK